MPASAQILVFSDFPGEGELLEGILREISGREVQAVSNLQTALETLAPHSPEIIFAHAREGALQSTTFLNEVWKQNPKTARFLFADASVDSDALVRCALGPHQVIRTPVDAEKLGDALKRAHAMKRFIRSEKVQALVSRMRTLPSRPSLSMEVMRELRSSHASASAVGELVSKDLAISTKLIQVANSAFYSVEQPVSSPAEAVLLLGLETTAALVLSVEAFARFDKLKPLYFSIDRVWKHGHAVAELARRIGDLMGCDAETGAQIYTAGLFHDIGKLALAQNFEEEYQDILRRAEDKTLSICHLENEVLGVTHAEAGAYLLAIWGLPLPIVEAVADHHSPPGNLDPSFSATTALHLAERLVGAPEKYEQIIAEYPRALGLKPRLDQIATRLGTSKIQPPSRVDVYSAQSFSETAPSAITRAATAPTGAAAPAAQPDVSQRAKAGSSPQRRFFYPAVAAILTLGAIVGYVFWPKPIHPIKVAAHVHKKILPAPAETRPEATPEKIDEAAESADEFSEVEAITALPVFSEADLEQVPAISETENTPPVASTEVVPAPHVELKLQAIMYDGPRSALVINGSLLRLGESVQGWEVVSIREHEVTVQNGAEQRVLGLR